MIRKQRTSNDPGRGSGDVEFAVSGLGVALYEVGRSDIVE